MLNHYEFTDGPVDGCFARISTDVRGSFSGSLLCVFMCVFAFVLSSIKHFNGNCTSKSGIKFTSFL